jgi:hypothetical protein
MAGDHVAHALQVALKFQQHKVGLHIVVIAILTQKF